LEFAIGFSQTAREYYKAQQRAQAEHEASEQDGTATSTTDEASIKVEDNHQEDVYLENTVSPDETSDQDAPTNQQTPFGHLSRDEFLKRIGIFN